MPCLRWRYRLCFALLHLPASSARMLAGAHNPVRFSDRCRYRRRPLTKLTKGGPGPRDRILVEHIRGLGDRAALEPMVRGLPEVREPHVLPARGAGPHLGAKAVTLRFGSASTALSRS